MAQVQHQLEEDRSKLVGKVKGDAAGTCAYESAKA